MARQLTLAAPACRQRRARLWPLLPASLLMGLAGGLLWLARDPVAAPDALALAAAPVPATIAAPAPSATGARPQPAAAGTGPETVVTGDIDVVAIAALQRQSMLRQRSPDSAARSVDEDAVARYRLARRQLWRMNGLSEDQKTEQLTRLYEQLPSAAQLALGRAELP